MLSSIIIYSFYTFFTITVLTKITLLILNIKHINNNFSTVPEEYSEIISLESHQKAQKYTTAKNKLDIFNILLGSVVVIGWISTGLLNEFISYFDSLDFGITLKCTLLIISYSMIDSLINIPGSLYSTFVIEEKFGFNKMTISKFLSDLIKQSAVSLIIGIPFLYSIIYIITNLGDLWWLVSWGFIMSFQFILIWAYPKFISPIFNKFKPLEDNELEAEISKLSQRTGIDFKDYFVMDASIRSSHGNAYFTGFGKNKRIVFFDTLLKTLNSSEVISVLAHELGHLAKKHILKMIVKSSLVLLAGLYILNLLMNSEVFFKAFEIQSNEPVYSFLLFLIVLPYYIYFITPLNSYSSRKNEYEADEFAAKHSDPNKLISALLKMYRDNSSTLTPHPTYSKFYFSHPPADERIKFLKSFT